MGFILLQATSWAFFIGRFHPLIVHLPIGFLLIAVLLEIGRRTGKIGVSESTISFILFWAAVGSTFACIAGYLLSLGGGYDAELLEDHKWAGIGVAAFAWVAWLAKSDFSDKIPFAPLFYLPSFALATVFLLSAGHDGGSLTHGEQYLTQYTPEPFRSIAGMPPLETESIEIKPIANINEAVVYQDIVQPILKNKCTQCHNSSKQKGDLRLDELALIAKGGKNGPAFIAGKGAESDMIKRCLLPEGDDDHMPPKGKPQLSPDQVSLISWWIDQGASADKKVSELKTPDQLKPVLAKLAGPQSEGGATATASVLDGLTVPQPDAKLIEGLKNAGLIVNRLSADKNLLEVSAVNAPNFDDKQIALLLPLADQIVWLKVGKTKVSDQGMKEISKLKNLNKLHIEHTQITDAGLAPLKGLSRLEYLNVVDTKVSDAGLKNILGSKSLKSVYVWESGVTEIAASELRKSYPNVKIIGGLDSSSAAIFAKVDTLVTEKRK